MSNQEWRNAPLFASKNFKGKFGKKPAQPVDTDNEFDQHMQQRAAEHRDINLRVQQAAADVEKKAAVNNYMVQGRRADDMAIAAATRPGDPAQIAKAADAVRFMFAGNATFTLRSKKTGTRYTYKVQIKQDDTGRPPVWFVKLLSGPDNTGDYTYLGMVKGNRFQLTAKSKMRMDSAPVLAFAWTLDKLNRGMFHAQLEMWHEGRCGRCGRKLTVPESIANGLGPECAAKGGF